MGNPNCYSYALGKLLVPTGVGQARPGSSAKVLGQYLDDRVRAFGRGEKLLHGIWADLRCFRVADGQILPLKWNADTKVPGEGGKRVIAMIYNDLGFHFYRKDGAVWSYISGMDNTVKNISEDNLLGRVWGSFNDASWTRGYFISFPVGTYGPLAARAQEWWVG